MPVQLPENFTARPATLDDIEAAVALVNLCSVELIGRPEWKVEEFRNDWQSPTLHPETDLYVVFTPGGEMVGYAGVWDSEPHVRLFGWANVHPEYRGQGIGSYLCAWLEDRVKQAIPKAPENAKVTLSQSKLTNDKAGHEFLLAHGYTVTRYFSRMLIELECPPPDPVFPAGIVVRTFDVPPEHRDATLRAIIEADQDIFRDHWGFVEHPLDQEYKEWTHWIENDPNHDPSVWFLAMEGDEIAGLSLCWPTVAEDPDMAYVGSLGVRRQWRRKGIALALLHHSFGEFYRRGKRRVALDVDAASLTGATRLYAKAGMHVQRQSGNYDKELRPGEDISTQSLSEG